MKKEVTRKALAVALILIIIVIFTFYLISVFNKTRFDAECVKDSDCIKVQATCCSCNSGGDEKCVPADEKEKYEKELEKCSEENFCAQVYNCKIEKCSCIGGKCAG